MGFTAVAAEADKSIDREAARAVPILRRDETAEQMRNLYGPIAETRFRPLEGFCSKVLFFGEILVDALGFEPRTR